MAKPAAHVEHHFTATAVVRDLVIGMSDGLTVPFALAAGLSAVAGSHLILLAGAAEIAAGSIAMGLGGYLAARTDAEHYEHERQREIRETREIPEQEAAEVRDVFAGWGLAPDQIGPIVDAIRSDDKRWIDFMMRFELGLEEPDPRRALQSAITIASAYIIGGLIPLSPYMFISSASEALRLSVGVTVLALFLFGLWKANLTGVHPIRGGIQTTMIGGLAAAGAFAIARLFR
jgi:VIT1/CCC1 family predicted Fe2+/Mn2+ transporter